jgi:hypothetical protein
MKISLIFLLLFFATCVVAQNPLVGTWEMVSIKGINAEGERFAFDTSSVREIKIITPDHYMLIAHTVEDDSLIFNRSYAGEVKLKGNQYIETPLLSSLPIFDNVKSNFLWKIEGDKFIQSGTFTRPDGKTVILDELVFRKVTAEQVFEANPAIGFWEQLSSSYTNFDGVKGSHTKESATRYHLITPSHWMRISHRDNKFEHAMGGTYSMKDGKTYPVVSFSSFAAGVEKFETTEKVQGDKMYVTGIMTSPEGKKFLWEDVFVRVK